MPNVLPFDCPEDLVKRFAEDDRWTVGIAVHADDKEKVVGQQVSKLPDPRHWNLIIDECRKDNPPLSAAISLDYSLPVYVVSQSYLDESDRAHAIRLCGQSQHLPQSTSAGTPEGHRTLEFNATNDHRSIHLLDFLEEFERDFARYALHFTYGRWGERWPDDFNPLFLDSYKSAVAGLFEETPDWLLVVDVPDIHRRVEALQYLAYRVAPKLWPDIYSDSLLPRRVMALMQQKDAMIGERRKLEKQLEEQIQQELAFYAPFVNLPYVGDEALKQLVKRVFEDVFRFDVRDLDSDLGANEPKRLDLLVQMSGLRALVEVRGSGTRNARINPDIDQLETNVQRSERQLGKPDVKMLVFNGMYMRSADERKQNAPFSEDMISEAKARSITLVSTWQLLEAIEKFRNEEVTIQQLVQTLSRPGVFEVR